MSDEIKKFTATDLEFKELARIDNLVNHDSISHPDNDKSDWEIRDRGQIRNRLLLYKNNILIGAIYYSQGKDENGRTPLMISAMWGSSSVMEFLLEKGADKTIKDHNRNDVVFFVKHSSFPRDEDKKEMLSLLEDKNEGCDG